MEGFAIKVENVSKTFKLPHEKNSSIKSTFVNLLRTKRGFELQRVLNDISFEIKEGEFFGIVGRNGSGKSTLLKLLAGIYVPTSGQIHIRGKLTPFIELGVGFNPELTGRENVYLNGALLGFNRKEMNFMYQDIVNFAELERFMDQKLKNYSSGMQVRLAFSIAIRAQSDILLIDEVLAVGDASFQQKCFDYFKQLKKEKRTVILVSHDAGALRQYCTKGILIDNGKITRSGDIDYVVNTYQDSLVEYEKKAANFTSKSSKDKRWGNHHVVVESGSIGNSRGKNQQIFTDKDDLIPVSIKYRAVNAVEKPTFGIIINDATGQQIFASNTKWNKVNIEDMPGSSIKEVEWLVPNIFNTGSYTISPAASDTTGTVIYDWREDFINFKIRKKNESSAQTNVAHKIRVLDKGGKP
jgi:ABC-2 type transport system ATP-binding protein